MRVRGDYDEGATGMYSASTPMARDIGRLKAVNVAAGLCPAPPMISTEEAPVAARTRRHSARVSDVFAARSADSRREM